MSRVLVVEDESAIAELISINLRHAGYEVTIAAAADQAQHEVDVLRDVHLFVEPRSDGFAADEQGRARDVGDS